LSPRKYQENKKHIKELLKGRDTLLKRHRQIQIEINKFGSNKEKVKEIVRK